ncbi:MAG TPA: sce7726 family protein [Geothrix sp.]|jgi:hypothetical protein
MAALIDDSGLSDMLPERATNRTLLETVYDLLQQHYRCEYVYKNTIARKILVGRHRLADATMATELRCDSSKADFVILNGTSTVYEIKTELDNLDRLPSQIQAYRKMFDRVFVVAHDSFAEGLEGLLDLDIGILSMTPRGALRQLRASGSHSGAVDSGCIFDSLRKSEYIPIVERYFGPLPPIPNTKHYSHCRDLFSSLPPATAHREMVLALKQRFRLPVDRPFLERIPESLVAGLFGAQITTVQAESLAGFMDLEYAPS